MIEQQRAAKAEGSSSSEKQASRQGLKASQVKSAESATSQAGGVLQCDRASHRSTGAAARRSAGRGLCRAIHCCRIRRLASRLLLLLSQLVQLCFRQLLLIPADRIGWRANAQLAGQGAAGGGLAARFRRKSGPHMQAHEQSDAAQAAAYKAYHRGMKHQAGLALALLTSHLHRPTPPAWPSPCLRP